jgi:hypothetical protein
LAVSGENMFPAFAKVFWWAAVFAAVSIIPVLSLKKNREVLDRFDA